MKPQSPKKYTLWDLQSIFSNSTDWPLKSTSNGWVPARPLHVAKLRERIKIAWDVFMGKLDALEWPDE